MSVAFILYKLTYNYPFALGGATGVFTEGLKGVVGVAMTEGVRFTVASCATCQPQKARIITTTRVRAINQFFIR